MNGRLKQRGECRKEGVKMNTIWVHEREAGEGCDGVKQNKSTAGASM